MPAILLPIRQAIISHIDTHEEIFENLNGEREHTSEQFRSVLYASQLWFGHFLIDCGRYREAEQLLLRIIGARGKMMKSGYIGTITGMINLAKALDYQ